VKFRRTVDSRYDYRIVDSRYDNRIVASRHDSQVSFPAIPSTSLEPIPLTVTPAAELTVAMPKASRKTSLARKATQRRNVGKAAKKSIDDKTFKRGQVTLLFVLTFCNNIL
jgi:hypothetical protein